LGGTTTRSSLDAATSAPASEVRHPLVQAL